MAREASQLWVAKGKNIQQFNMKKDDVTDEELAKLLTGPSGTLRAPAIRRGKKLFVGFHAEELKKQMVP
jgi:arsenate reductase-like glutaredoxin family protein